MNKIELFLQENFGVSEIGSEKSVFLPNEIFNIFDINRFKNGKHRLFAIVYYYNVCWIYRYAKTESIMSCGNSVKDTLMTMCGVGINNNKFDYIIKKNGVLDNLKITKTISVLDSPCVYIYDSDVNFLEFEMIRDYDFFSRYSTVATFKEPLLNTKHRYINGSKYHGTFYDIEYSIKLDMSMYLRMLIDFNMSYESIGFYIYLLSLSNFYGCEVNISREKMSLDLGVSVKFITSMKKVLKKNNLITEKNNGKNITGKNNTIRIVNGVI